MNGECVIGCRVVVARGSGVERVAALERAIDGREMLGSADRRDVRSERRQHGLLRASSPPTAAVIWSTNVWSSDRPCPPPCRHRRAPAPALSASDQLPDAAAE
jgi:hypothetical protein